jgi:RHS repeat-associated protein
MVEGTVEVVYDNDFRVATQLVNGADSIQFAYDDDGLLVQAGALTLGRNSTNGLLTADTLGPVRSAYQYSTRGELSGYRVKHDTTTLFATGYVRDSLGRIVQLFDTTQGTPTRWSFVYDSLGRLVKDSVNGAVFHVFTYDANGNRLSYTSGAGTVNYSYDNQDRLLWSRVGTDTTHYTYGSNGELKMKIAPGADTTTYSYDALGNLITVVLPDATEIEYVIDGQNRRVGRKVDGVLVQSWLYQNQLNPIAELDSAGNVVSWFVYGSRANVPDYMIRGDSVFRLVTDHLGSVRLVVDTATGTVVQRLDYDEWGNVTQNTNPELQPLGFGGGVYDELTALVRFGARDYAPANGRWVSKDPLRLGSGDQNLYQYATNDPVNLLDPFGLWWLADLANFAAGFGDAITFGLTDRIRDLIDANDIIDKCSGWYQGGQWTAVGAEIALSGGSAVLKSAAKSASRSAVRSAARKATRKIAQEGLQVHHLNPLFGHPSGGSALFPTGGLPASIHSGGWNLRLLSPTAHLAAHVWMETLEELLKIGFNPAMTSGRVAANLERSCGCD